MPTATSEDTEITLGTGKMLALFFSLVALCAVFFATGFSLGKNSGLKPTAEVVVPAAVSPGNVRPSAVKASSTTTASSDSAAVLKPVEDKPATNPSAPAENSNTAAETTTPPPAPANNATAPDAAAVPVLNGYYVQVAAVSKPEDADALVDALKKKQYPAFSANASPDKLYHVQVGPYGDVKDAELMRAKLVSDGYNPILKK